MNICIYSPAFPPYLKDGGGCALRYYSMTKEFLKDGCKVSLLTPHNEDSILNSSYMKDLKGIDYFKIYKLPHLSFSNIYSVPLVKINYKTILNILNIFRKNNFDIMLITDCPELILILCLAKICNIKYTIYGIHTDFLKMFDSLDFNLFIKYILKFLISINHICGSRISDHCAISSLQFKKKVENRIPWKFIKIDTDFESILWSSNFKPRVLSQSKDIHRMRNKLSRSHPFLPLCVYVGRWSSEKRIHLLPKAIPNNWKLAIVGDGPISKEIHKLCSKNVYVYQEFLDSQKLAMVYYAADFIVSASDFETLGFIVPEAFACETPVAVQNEGGFKEKVTHKENGLLLDYNKPTECIELFNSFDPSNGTNYKNLLKNIKNIKNIKKSTCYSLRFYEKHINFINSTNKINFYSSLNYWVILGVCSCFVFYLQKIL